MEQNFREDIKLSMHGRVRKTLDNPELTEEQKRELIKVIVLEKKDFFINNAHAESSH
jgi:hypothetical protein